jgi:hypothetical protein
LPKGITIYKALIFALDFPIIVTFAKKALQIFCATNECDSDSKRMEFLINKLKKSGRALQYNYLGRHKNSSRSGSKGSSFGMWVARTIFSQLVHLSIKVVDLLSLVYTKVSYKLMFSRWLTKW